MRYRSASIALVILLAAGPAYAQSFRTHVKGDEVRERTATVVHAEKWSKSLDELMARAKGEKKLIFWLQLVGDLAGGL